MLLSPCLMIDPRRPSLCLKVTDPEWMDDWRPELVMTSKEKPAQVHSLPADDSRLAVETLSVWITRKDIPAAYRKSFSRPRQSEISERWDVVMTREARNFPALLCTSLQNLRYESSKESQSPTQSPPFTRAAWPRGLRVLKFGWTL